MLRNKDNKYYGLNEPEYGIDGSGMFSDFGLGSGSRFGLSITAGINPTPPPGGPMMDFSMASNSMYVPLISAFSG